MKLLTKTIENKFTKFPLYSQDGKGKNARVLVKYFNPYGVGTWLITEAEKLPDGDYRLYGYMELGYGWEWGYVLLSELMNYRNRWGLGFEYDRYISDGATVADLCRGV